MYKLIVWDKFLAATDQDGGVAELEVPVDLAKYLFELDSTKFPLLSGLSFDDYDLFSDVELTALVEELRRVEESKPAFVGIIETMVSAIALAKSMGKAILFDPFQRE